jgi:hypothetical protein
MKILTRIIAAIEVLAGAIGTFLVIWTAIKSIKGLAGHSGLLIAVVILIFLLFLYLFILSIFAGIKLWKGEAKGYKWSKILQALQIPMLQTKAISYSFTLGLKALVGLIVPSAAGATAQLSWGIAADVNYHLSFSNPHVAGVAFGINLLALAFLIILIKANKNTISY